MAQSIPDGVGRDSKSVGGRESNRRSITRRMTLGTTRESAEVVVVP
jgi:hypothetical protein